MKPKKQRRQAPVLVEAQKLIRERDAKYGSPRQSFAEAAGMFNTLTGKDLEAADIPLIQAILKLTRMKRSKGNRDHYVDIAGYIALMFEVVEGQDGEEK